MFTKITTIHLTNSCRQYFFNQPSVHSWHFGPRKIRESRETPSECNENTTFGSDKSKLTAKCERFDGEASVSILISAVYSYMESAARHSLVNQNTESHMH